MLQRKPLTQGRSSSLFLAALLGALFGCQPTVAAADVEGSGVRKEEKRTLSGFDTVEISNALEAEVIIQDRFEVVVVGDDNLLARVETKVAGKRLLARLGKGSVRPKNGLKVLIKLPALKGLGASGAAQVTVQGLSGDQLDVDASGSSRIGLQGHLGSLDVNLSGASRIDGRGLAVDTANLDVSGASQVHIRAKRSVTGDASGASRVEVLGNPSKLDVNTSGASSVKRAG